MREYFFFPFLNIMHATPLTDVDIKCAWNVVPVDINGRIIFIIL